ncbi:hypothetical protein FJTKL_12122 [Diaporthe vaccinii]|uniref:Uncharacterized protein n=1 Tax=Diaporthe vaccinii TaxID=105482 RepID=A0ABR4EF58_9PEZI
MIPCHPPSSPSSRQEPSVADQVLPLPSRSSAMGPANRTKSSIRHHLPCLLPPARCETHDATGHLVPNRRREKKKKEKKKKAPSCTHNKHTHTSRRGIRVAYRHVFCVDLSQAPNSQKAQSPLMHRAPGLPAGSLGPGETTPSPLERLRAPVRIPRRRGLMLTGRPRASRLGTLDRWHAAGWAMAVRT